MSTLLILLGLSLYFLPGLWLMVVLAFAEYLLVLRGMPALAAMKESLRLTRGHFWRILVCLLCVMTPLWLLKGASVAAYPEPAPLLGLLMDQRPQLPATVHQRGVVPFIHADRWRRPTCGDMLRGSSDTHISRADDPFNCASPC